MWHLLEGRHLLEGGAYFSVDTQRCSTYLRSATYLRKYGISKRIEHQHNLRHNSPFTIPGVNSLYHGTEIVSFLSPKIWNIGLSWHSCSMWDKAGWVNWLWQFLCERLSSFNPKGFYYLYAWSRSLYEGRTSFCLGLISR